MKLTKNKIPLFVVFGLSFIVGLILLIVPFTSQMPDGLEKVSKHTVGFIKKDDFKSSVDVLLPGYTVPAIKHKFDTKRYAGIIGVLVVFGITVFVGYLLKKRRKNS
ncbi:MAG: hypothetical protein FJ266_01835 [Planctomycetes bacterium]|nr:hypothetical protein [Planctomycetota bacterium]